MSYTDRQIQVDVTSRHGHISSRMEAYAKGKAERLAKFSSRVSRIEIVVDGPHDAPEVEMIAHVDNAPHVVAKDRDDHFSTCVDRLCGKVERQLVKMKDKSRGHPGDPSIRGMPLEDADLVDADDDFRV